MSPELDVGPVANALPDLTEGVHDPRLRPIGLVGGFGLVLVGAIMQIPAATGFWASVLSGVLVFVGVPVFCVGLAAPEPPDEDDPFRLGIDLSHEQRHLVATGSLLVLVSPMLVAAVGPVLGFSTWLWLGSALFAVFGSVLILTGFIAWTSRAIGQSSPTS